MSERLFNKVACALWQSDRFRDCSDPAKLLFVYFLTSPHQNSSGCYRILDGYACADMGWPPERYAETRHQLILSGLIDFDQATYEVYVERWFRHCAPDNPKHAHGTAKRVEQIASARLREKVRGELTAANEARVRRKEREEAERTALQLIRGGRPAEGPSASSRLAPYTGRGRQ